MLAGAGDESHLLNLRRLLARAVVIPMRPTDYEDAAALYRQCRRQGTTVRKPDRLLIAAVAIRAGTPNPSSRRRHRHPRPPHQRAESTHPTPPRSQLPSPTSSPAGVPSRDPVAPNKPGAAAAPRPAHPVRRTSPRWPRPGIPTSALTLDVATQRSSAHLRHPLPVIPGSAPGIQQHPTSRDHHAA